MKERQVLSKNNRRLDRKIKEQTVQVEDEKRHAEQYRDQVGSLYFLWWLIFMSEFDWYHPSSQAEKAALRVKTLKSSLDEAEEESNRLNVKGRRVQVGSWYFKYFFYGY